VIVFAFVPDGVTPTLPVSVKGLGNPNAAEGGATTTLPAGAATTVPVGTAPGATSAPPTSGAAPTTSAP
jgi:hypothetical protein